MMFENYIYILSALLLSNTYQPPRDAGSMPLSSLFLLIVSTGLFVYVVKRVFRRVEEVRMSGGRSLADRMFGLWVTRLSILSLFLFTADIYLLDLKLLLSGVVFFQWFPSLGEMAVILLFLFYQALIWNYAYSSYVGLSRVDISRRDYVVSNVSFLLPVMFPWFVFTFIPDLANILPFEAPGRFLQSGVGEFVYYILFFAAAVVTGPMFIVRFWGCRPLPGGSKRRVIEAMCGRAGISYSEICVWPVFGGRMVTAGVMGVLGRFRYILVTPSLLEYLTDDELGAVIAHEIGHVKKYHILLYLLVFSGFMVLAAIAADPLMLAMISFRPLGMLLLKAGEGGGVIISALTGIVLIISMMFYLRFLFGYFMRNFERQADVYVYSLIDSARDLINTFFKIVRLSGQHPDKPSWHHFSISRRIGYLKRCEEDRSHVDIQNRKVGRMLTVYVITLFACSILAWNINFGGLSRVIDGYYKERLYSMVMENPVENYAIYDMLAMVYYDAGDFGKAVQAYEKSISVNPVNVHALNNLAWLYATCSDAGFRDPEKAVSLAEKAVVEDRSPHVLDTLAESYFITGRVDEARALALEALEKAAGDKGHYRSQLEKFSSGSK